MSLYDSATEEMRRRADYMIELIKDGTLRPREDPTITRCRNLDKSTPEFSEEKILENTPNPDLMEDIMKGAYE
jgi:hypothetical protein